MSTATLFFLSFFAILTRSFCTATDMPQIHVNDLCSLAFSGNLFCICSHVQVRKGTLPLPNLRFCQRAANEDDDALALVLVLPVLQRQLRDLHCRRKVGLALDV